MAPRILNARSLGTLRPVAGKQVDYFDSKVTGLALRVTAAGAKSWTVLYRHRGRLRRLTLGSVDVITLADARERARETLAAASNGKDPAAVKQDGRQAATIGDLAERYLEKYAKVNKRSWRADKNLIDNKILPRWRNRAILDIKRHDCIALVEAVADKGAPIVANRVAALLSTMFNFALNRDLLDDDEGIAQPNPAVRIPRPGVERQRDRVLSEDDLRAIWLAFETLPAPMAAFYKLRLLTAQRGGEVAAMRWTDLNLANRWWTIPAAGSKNNLAHRVPLNASALAILRGIPRADADERDAGPQTIERATYVLAGARGKRQQAEAAATFTVPDFRGHDLRRTVASFMASGGVPRLVISKILNHVERSVTAVYDRHTYDAEKEAALTWWDAKLAAILANEGARVLAFQRSA